MGSTNSLTADASPDNRSKQEKSLRKAEKKRLKKERKKLEKKRKAEEAASLAEQTPTVSQALQNELNMESSAPALASIDTPTPAPRPAARPAARVSKEVLKSAQANYVRAANVTSEHVNTSTVTSKLAVNDISNGEQDLGEESVTNIFHGPRTGEASQSARGQPTIILPVDKRVADISPSTLSVPEYENTVVMLDFSGLGSPEKIPLWNPSIPNSVDSDDETIEETITTQGARAALSRSPSTLAPKTHLQALDLSVDPDVSDDEVSSILGDSDPRDHKPEEIKPKGHAGFPAPEDLPEWFPRNIKQIYRVDRHGGALSFKASIIIQSVK
ncbi:hypothetical protein ONS96_001789 [Cadophora gregata f. sp. sojae]|nr:hypothetical protein ONS96_001789 [Cadophora gregata f. sp. sojae]